MTRVIVAQTFQRRRLFFDANEFSAFVAQEYLIGNFLHFFYSIYGDERNSISLVRISNYTLLY